MIDGIRFAVKGDPVPKARPRIGHGTAYTPARTKHWQEAVAWEARFAMSETGRDLFTSPVAIQMRFAYGNHGADLDNLVKAVWDALNGVVWKDDVLVEQMAARIVRGVPKPERGVIVEVWPVLSADEIEAVAFITARKEWELFLAMGD